MAAFINYTKYVDQKPARKTLHIRLALIILVGISIPTVSFFITQNPLVSTLAGLISLCLAIFAVFYVLKPLQTFLKAIQSLGDGNLNYRLDIRSNDEFEDVGSSFNLMAQKISQNFQNLEQDRNKNLSERNTIDAVLSSIIDGVIALDMSKNVVSVNKAAEYLTGYNRQEFLGKPIDQFLRLFSEAESIDSKTYCQDGYSQSLMLINKNGGQKKVTLSRVAVTEGIQTNIGCILILRDISKEEELEQMKFDFVSMASHELKTPLTNIIGYLSVFINENKTKIGKEALDLLERSAVSAKVLLTLVENLLSVNKIERDQLSVTVEPSDYLTVLSKAIDDLQNQAKVKNITLTLAPLKRPLPKVLLDQIRIVEIINNLISNAIKYTPAGGRVEVSLGVTPQEVITTVSDTGMGIPKEAMPHLFNKFFRVSNTAQKAQKGTGLGLYIAKSIVEKLNGKIWVESELGKGSKFHFTLPLVPKTQANIPSDAIVGETIQSGALNY